MKNPRTVGKRIADFHNEKVPELSAARKKRSQPENVTWVAEEVVRLAEDAVEETYARTTEETADFNHKLLDFARANINACFDWLHDVLNVRSPPEFIAISMKHSEAQYHRVRQEMMELVNLAQKAGIENMGPLGNMIGNTLMGRLDLA